MCALLRISDPLPDAAPLLLRPLSNIPRTASANTRCLRRIKRQRMIPTSNKRRKAQRFSALRNVATSQSYTPFGELQTLAATVAGGAPRLISPDFQ